MLTRRKANLTDLSFIYGCILYGARKGHYSLNSENPEMISFMKKEIQSVISHNVLLDKREAEALIFTLNNKRVGMLILSDYLVDSRGIEIYALSIAKRYQQQGYGSQALDQLLRHYLYEDLHARCSQESKEMKNLLLRRGFEVIAVENNHSILFRQAFERMGVFQSGNMNYQLSISGSGIFNDYTTSNNSN